MDYTNWDTVTGPRDHTVTVLRTEAVLVGWGAQFMLYTTQYFLREGMARKLKRLQHLAMQQQQKLAALDGVVGYSTQLSIEVAGCW